MPQITDIKPQKYRQRFNIYLDGEFAFSLSAEALAKADLKTDTEIDKEKVEQLIKDDEYIKTYDRALKFLSFRPRSKKELLDWFKRKEIGEETQKLISRKLEGLGLVNDTEFARWWVEQRKIYHPAGKKLLKLELFKKGISREIIDEILSQEEPESEMEAARKIVEKKLRTLKSPNARKTLIGVLSRRGFSWETIKDVLDENSLKS